MITHIQRTSTGPILRIQSDFTGIISAKNSRARRHERVPLARRLRLSKNQAVLEALRSRVKAIRRRKEKKYDTWSQAEQRLLVQLWAENHELLESRESRTAWRKICEEVNARMEISKTVEKCIKKIKYLIDRYKEAKEWSRKQSGGSKKQSLFYDEIDAVLGCRDIATLGHVSEAGTTSTHASSSSATSSSASSAASGDHSGTLKEDAGEQKKKEVRSERKKTQGKEAAQTWKERKKRKDGSFGKVWVTLRNAGIILIPL